MSTFNLEAVFAPRAIALIGASHRRGAVGAVAARNLLAAGFAGPVRLVNPHVRTIAGAATFPDIAALPEAPDLAVIAIPAEGVADAVAQLGARGGRAAVVLSAGFEGEAGALRRAALLAAARPHGVRLVGPNCLGVLSPAARVNASFARAMPPAGSIALVSQSGAIAAAAIDAAAGLGFGFSHVVTVGDCADVDVADVLDWLAGDPQTHGVLLYLEGVSDGRKFLSAARVCARAKPVAVLKAGRSAAGAKAALTHTGALAGAAAVYDAAFRRAGMVPVEDLGGLLQAGTSFAAGLRDAGPRLAVLTNGGGAGVLATDALAALGEAPAPLSPDLRASLARLAPAGWSDGDPVDILGDAHPRLYGAAAEILLASPETDALLVVNCPTAVADSAAAADAVVRAAQHRAGKPVLAAWLGGDGATRSRRKFAAAGLPDFETPEAAVRAFAQLARLRRCRALLDHTPAAAAPARPAAAARALAQAALAEGRSVLTDPEARDLLGRYGIPVIPSQACATPEDAAAAAARFAQPVALKVLSRDISHKSDVGGVRLGVSPADTAQAARNLLTEVAARRPDARLDGVVVEPMAARPAAEEVIVGVLQDPTFGPVILVGQGGVAVEIDPDRALGLPPLNPDLAQDLIGQTRLARRLAGYRGRPAADRAALADVLVALGQLATDVPEIAELDINPLLCDADGVLALDARIRLAPVTAATPKPAILPYPAELTQKVTVAGEALTLRVLRPDDAPRLQAMLERSTRDDVCLRFRGGMRRMSDDLLVRLTQLDYDRHLALVAEAADGALLGVGRLIHDPDGAGGEFALMVRSDAQGRGLGRRLLQALVEAAAARGLTEVWGDVAAGNDRMLATARALGFGVQPGAELGRVRVTRWLDVKADGGSPAPNAAHIDVHEV